MCLCVCPCKCEDKEKEKERGKFCKEFNECLKEFEERQKIIVRGNVNVKVSKEGIDEACNW